MVSHFLSGVILRVFPSGRICLFTHSLGKIFCFVRPPVHKNPLVPGSLLDVHLLEKREDLISIEHIEHITYPIVQTAAQLNWLHHVLELYYFFICEHQPSNHDFIFLKRYLHLMHMQHTTPHVHLQRLAVSHFLVHTGFHEQPALHHYAQVFEKVVDPAAVSEVPFSLNSTEETAIQDLILRCLQEHPQFHKFKTVSFLYERNFLSRKEELCEQK
jgi:hypothetical protein